MSKKAFKFRGFVSLLTTFSFLISLISGIILYFTPQGRIANWTNWTIWGLTKETWGALHINSSLVLFIVVIFHIYYNWSLLIGYIKKRAQMAISLKKEMAVALFLSVFTVMASLNEYQPFAAIIKWNEDIKDYWAAKAMAEPPIAHAEELTVKEFCDQFGFNEEKFARLFAEKNWRYENSSQTLKALSKANNISPADIYALINKTPEGEYKQINKSGRGWGRLTIAMVCDQEKLDQTDALARLASAGISAGENDNIRTLADKHGKRPVEIVETITGREIAHE